MTQPHDRDPTPSRWAPWWVYLIVLLGANQLRSWVLPTGHLPTIMAVSIAVAQAAVLFVLVTAAWRLTRRPSSDRT